MNSLKTLFVSVVLVAVLYGVYLAMNRGPEPTTPMEVAEAWDGSLADGGLDTQMRVPTVLQGTVGGSTASTAPTATSVVPAPKMAIDFNIPGNGPGGPGGPGRPDSHSHANHAASSAPPKQAVPTAAIPQTPLTTPLTTLLQAAAKAGPPAGSTLGSPNRQSFADLMATARGELDRNRLLDAYRMLSNRYRDPMFTPAENGQIERLLDQLAGTIVYSTQHFIERPHLIGPDETLEKIAHRYQVPSQLLAKINGLAPSKPLKPGSWIKVVRGPFSAEINLAKRELTLRLPDGGYAGRFAIGVGHDVPQIDKSYRVFDKIETPPAPTAYLGAAPSAKQKWIGLEGRLGIHAATNPANVGRSTAADGITLRARDVDDLYDILSVGSQVVIRR